MLASFSLNALAQSVTTSVTSGLQAKECIINDEKTQEPKTKKVFYSDQSGKRVEMHTYKWDRKSKEWVAAQKTEYKYDTQNNLSQIISMEWDRAQSNWSNKKVQDINT